MHWTGSVNKYPDSNGSNKFKQFTGFCHTFDLTNLINVKNCYNSATSPPSLNVVLTNRLEVFKRRSLLPHGLASTTRRWQLLLDHHTRASLREISYIDILENF